MNEQLRQELLALIANAPPPPEADPRIPIREAFPYAGEGDPNAVQEDVLAGGMTRPPSMMDDLIALMNTPQPSPAQTDRRFPAREAFPYAGEEPLPEHAQALRIPLDRLRQ